MANEETKVAPKAKADVKAIRKIADMLLGRKTDGERLAAGAPVMELRNFGKQIVDMAGDDERLVMFGQEIAKATGTPDVFGAATQIVQELEKRSA